MSLEKPAEPFWGDDERAVPLGKPWDRQPNSGKLRRKLVSVPGLRCISGQLSRPSSPKHIKPPATIRASAIAINTVHYGLSCRANGVGESPLFCWHRQFLGQCGKR